MTPDPYEPHLRQAQVLFDQGETVKAGQIWQAILKQQPDHAVARERLLAVKQHLLALREAQAVPPIAHAPAPPPPAEPPITPPPPSPVEPTPNPRATAPEAALPRPLEASPDPDRLLGEGCTLYDMGQVEDALRKWEQLLLLDPAHGLARGYANGARRELGLPPLAASEEAPPAPMAGLTADEDMDKLLREAVQLYDMGLVEEAISKWERVLALEPHRQEVRGYLHQARAEVRQAPAAKPEPTPASTPAEGLDLKLRQAEHLLNLQRHEEAAFTFQQALGLAPGNARALDGLERCRRPGGPRPGPGPALAPTPTAPPLDSRGRIAMAVDTPPPPEPTAVAPPATLQKTLPPPREGLSLPDRLLAATRALPWLRDPKVLASLAGSAVVLVAGLLLVQRFRRDQALKQEVQAARAAALAPLAQQAQAPDLAEAAEALREEARAALDVDPLRAYLRAEALLSRNPGDGAAAQLLEKARNGLPGGATGASLPEFQKHLQNGDLEAAARVMDALLRATPGDGDLRARAARLHLALCAAHAGQGKWEEAHDDLLRGRALFPGDKAWTARIQLLGAVKTLPKAQQEAWIALLG